MPFSRLSAASAIRAWVPPTSSSLPRPYDPLESPDNVGSEDARGRGRAHSQEDSLWLSLVPPCHHRRVDRRRGGERCTTTRATGTTRPGTTATSPDSACTRPSSAG